MCFPKHCDEFFGKDTIFSPKSSDNPQKVTTFAVGKLDITVLPDILVNQEAFIDALLLGYQELRKFLYQVKDKATIDAYEVCKRQPHAASGRRGVVIHIGVGSIVARSTWWASEGLW